MYTLPSLWASPPQCNWPDRNKQDILSWLLFHDVLKQQRISLGCQKPPQEHLTTLHNASTNVFPDSNTHLCAWHINKNITANFKKHFPPESLTAWDQFMKIWNSVTDSRTMESFEERLSELKKFLSKWSAVLEYLKNTILLVKEHFVVALPSHFLHLRNFNTSHSENPCVMWLTTKSLIFFCLPQQIFKHTILKAKKQFKILERKDSTKPCSQMFYKGSDIPGSHMIGEIIKEHTSLDPDDFHPHWCLDYNPECSVFIYLFFR
ncbi:uncharacterized protein VP01_461g6 [Puccinia sorghi]|uniref:MULE transposase domain-containing protein n=1 Tax=Puccinia sorghi TaxID=27349 RepID=A0A0L6UP82_9BASI|nr:uncharacterized protein VP01_461g6 [Puccinia sorghi]